jgi:hypothetical protein
MTTITLARTRREAAEVVEAMHAAHDLARIRVRDTAEGMGMVGYMVAWLRDGDGHTLQLEPAANLITDAGDLYYAGKAIVAVSPANPTAPTAASGMKLGTGTSAATKSGSAAALGAYISGSNAPFDATFPKTVNLGGGLGVNAQYQVTWPNGTATNGAITESVLVNDGGTNATSTAANTYHRVAYGAINKTATDSFVNIWNAKFLGA